MIYARFFPLSVCSSQIWSLALAHQRHIGIRNTPLGTGSGLFLPFFSSFSGTMLSSSLPSASSSPSSAPLASGTNPASGSGTNYFLLAPGVTVDDPVSMFIGTWEDPAAENEALASGIIPAPVACTFVNNPSACVDRPLCTVPRILLQCYCNCLSNLL